MKATPYWVSKQLAIVARPRGEDWLDDEMAALREAGIDVVVSMLEEDEAAELGLRHEGDAAQRSGLVFISFPIVDRSVPDKLKFDQFLERLEGFLKAGKRVGVHCRACIGRASVTTASLLIRSGISPEDVWSQISSARGYPVPDTFEQREWVERNMSRIA
jgi:protein-tyrosine phosphatase